MNFKALDAYLDTFYSEKNIPGVGCAVSLNGKIIHKHFAGYANVEERRPFADDTLVNLCSATKISTITSAMRLVERGVLGLDEPASKYIPQLGKVNVLQPDGSVAPAKNVMLVRHLMSMSAGFTYNRDTPSLNRLMEQTDGKPTLRQAVEAMACDPLIFEPGTHFRYSTCHDVLGAVMEAAADMPYPDVLKKELFDPLGMVDTTFVLNDAQRARMAPVYHDFNGATGTAREIVYRESADMGLGPNYRSGGGGLISCVRDYALLAAMLGNGGVTADGLRILKPETIRMMQTNQMTPEGQLDFEAMGGWSKMGYGYGLGVRTLMNRERNNSLSENGEFGWDGAYGCYLVADPARKIGIFYAQQEAGSQWYTWHGTVRNFAYAAILGAED